MKSPLLFIHIVILLQCYTVQAQNTWNKIYDFCPDTNRASNSVAQYADDDVLIVAGHIQANNITDHICYIASIDYNGNLINSRNLESAGKINMLAGGAFDKIAYPLNKVGNNKYMVCGVEQDAKTNSLIEVYQPFFYFFNKNCDSLLQAKHTDTIISRIPYSYIRDGQEDIVVTGMESSRKIHYDAWTQSYFWDSGYVWIAKYDANANLIWSKKLLGGDNFGTNQSGMGRGYKIISGHNGTSYLISGVAYHQSKNVLDQFFMKTNLDGDVLWLNYLPRKFSSAGTFDMIPLKDGTYGFVSTYSDTSGWPAIPTDIYYGKFDEWGDTIWTRHFHKIVCTNEGFIINEAENGDLLLFSKVFYDAYNHNTVIRTTPKGNIKWYREYKHQDSTLFTNVTSAMSYTPTRQVFLSGYFSSPQAVPGVFDTVGLYSWFVLTDTFGCIEPGCQAGDTVWWLTNVNDIAARAIEIKMYPNPVRNTLFVEVKSTSKKLHAVLMDISGRVLRKYTLTGNNKTPLDMQDLGTGLYILEVWDERQKLHTYKISRN